MSKNTKNTSTPATARGTWFGVNPVTKVVRVKKNDPKHKRKEGKECVKNWQKDY